MKAIILAVMVLTCTSALADTFHLHSSGEIIPHRYSTCNDDVVGRLHRIVDRILSVEINEDTMQVNLIKKKTAKASLYQFANERLADFTAKDDGDVAIMIVLDREPNHIDIGTVTALEERDIGEWEDDNPLNNRKTQIAAFQNLFAPPPSRIISEEELNVESEEYNRWRTLRCTSCQGIIRCLKSMKVTDKANDREYIPCPGCGQPRVVVLGGVKDRQ